MNAVETPNLIRDALLELKSNLSSASVLRENEPLSKRTTLRVGGPADLYIEPASEQDLAVVLRVCKSKDLPWMMLGRGSNLLVRDGGIRGVVICLTAPAFNALKIDGETIFAGAGVRLRALAFEARKVLLTGFEFMEGIPGNVGGALRMNAGAMGSAMFEVLASARFMDSEGVVQEKTVDQIPVEYRNCPLFKSHIVLSAVFNGRTGVKESIEQKMNECSQKRWKSQPAAPSAGCIFKNPVTIPTGRLVEELGLKGMRRGGAMISDVHGNFIVNDGNATARDILELIELVKEKARSARGVELHTEVQIVGEN
ncbi:MAG TPA: UDP-N-acetylmuramate dehydrogenase [Candidatus Kapabacteria bacterium]|nr:UDP-N-acetylmuramate dehydrogenase [Candidatus Kapabacteria bacterium]